MATQPIPEDLSDEDGAIVLNPSAVGDLDRHPACGSALTFALCSTRASTAAGSTDFTTKAARFGGQAITSSNRTR